MIPENMWIPDIPYITSRRERFAVVRRLYDEGRPDVAAGAVRLVFGIRRQCRLHASFLEYAPLTDEDSAILHGSRWWAYSRWANTLNV